MRKIMIAVAMLVVMSASAQHRNTFTEQYNMRYDQDNIVNTGEWTVTYNVNGNDITVHNALNDYTFFFEKNGNWVTKQFNDGTEWEECEFKLDGKDALVSHGLSCCGFFYIRMDNVSLLFTTEDPDNHGRTQEQSVGNARRAHLASGKDLMEMIRDAH